MGKEENKAAYCADCKSVFVYEARDIFAEKDIFCPACSGRCPDVYPTLEKALSKNSGAKKIRGIRGKSPL